MMKSADISKAEAMQYEHQASSTNASMLGQVGRHQQAPDGAEEADQRQFRPAQRRSQRAQRRQQKDGVGEEARAVRRKHVPCGGGLDIAAIVSAPDCREPA